MTQTIYSVSVVLLLLFAGCATYPGTSVHQADFQGTIERTDQGFRMNGTVMIDRGSSSDHNFSHVTVTLYSADKTAYRRIDLGNLTSQPNWGPNRKQVNITSGRQPKYVVIESPGLYEAENVRLKGFVWNGTKGYYTSYIMGSKSDRFGDDSSG